MTCSASSRRSWCAAAARRYRCRFKPARPSQKQTQHKRTAKQSTRRVSQLRHDYFCGVGAMEKVNTAAGSRRNEANGKQPSRGQSTRKLVRLRGKDIVATPLRPIWEGVLYRGK